MTEKEHVANCTWSGVFSALRVIQDSEMRASRDPGHLTPFQLQLIVSNPAELDNSPEILRHLNRCPVCRDRWVKAFRDGIILGTDGQGSDDYYTGGMMAAAAGGTLQPLTLESRCGRFVLEVRPQDQEKGQCMIYLHTGDKADDSDYEGVTMILRDRKGKLLVQGVFQEGWLTGKVDDLREFDLSNWALELQTTPVK